MPKTSFDQWKTLQAVVDCGGFAQAAERLHRSQSAVSYAVSQLQQQLGVPLLRIEGRKARLTDIGTVLLAHSRKLLQDATDLEQLAQRLADGWEAEIRLVVDGAMSIDFLFAALHEFSAMCPQTQIQLREVIMSGAEEALLNDKADVAICAWVPPNFLGNPLAETEFVAVAHHQHPLNKAGTEINVPDLVKHRQVVISDSGTKSKRDFGWLGAEQRWSFTHMSTAVAAIKSGLCFGWVPRHRVEAELASGELKILPLREGARYFAPLYLVRGIGRDGPATQKLLQLFNEHAQRCNKPRAIQSE